MEVGVVQYNCSPCIIILCLMLMVDLLKILNPGTDELTLILSLNLN